jgi:hypothetical protein
MIINLITLVLAPLYSLGRTWKEKEKDIENLSILRVA